MEGDTRDPEVEPETQPIPERPVPTFIGEVVERRSWPLIAVVFAFGLLLAAAPFLFMFEQSPYSEALKTYHRLCEAAAAHDETAFQAGVVRGQDAGAMARLPCVSLSTHKAAFEPVPHRAFGPERAYTLTLTPHNGATDPIRLIFRLEDGVMKWEPAQATGQRP